MDDIEVIWIVREVVRLLELKALQYNVPEIGWEATNESAALFSSGKVTFIAQERSDSQELAIVFT
jgi:hypothetical protein